MHRATRSVRLIVLCLAAMMLLGCGAERSTPRPDHDLKQTAALCPGVNVSGPGDPAGAGRVAKFYRTLTEPVYKAACADDAGRLAHLIDTGSAGAQHFESNACQGCNAGEIVAMWRDDYRLDLAELARLLETPPRWSQGGPVYIRGNRLAAFSRGWMGVPAFWSAFYPDCQTEENCELASELATSP
ncbi:MULTISPECIES: hypothetical protein [Streptomyces]|uniref:hypothetical protein n=1 Tax=Streptomyces TaxID=1883 RepID=UPI0006B25DAF|nr:MULTISPECIES: hypothetical protein [Streptomyces]KOT46940.1 hypothetical protein ADK43_40865 [Streptomyces rimosus subsp. rimosus]